MLQKFSQKLTAHQEQSVALFYPDYLYSQNDTSLVFQFPCRHDGYLMETSRLLSQIRNIVNSLSTIYHPEKLQATCRVSANKPPSLQERPPPPRTPPELATPLLPQKAPTGSGQTPPQMPGRILLLRPSSRHRNSHHTTIRGGMSPNLHPENLRT